MILSALTSCKEIRDILNALFHAPYSAPLFLQELQRDEQLVKRLTRQTKQEQRLVTQLLQIRMQKEVIRENRLFVEQQYQERREKDFREALNREAVRPEINNNLFCHLIVTDFICSWLFGQSQLDFRA